MAYFCGSFLVTMFDKAEDLSIEFVKLKDGKHVLDFRVDETFFEELGSKEVHKADVSVAVRG
jgi:methenyltetrahydromethanopterin cyclohydrolase